MVDKVQYSVYDPLPSFSVHNYDTIKHHTLDHLCRDQDTCTYSSYIILAASNEAKYLCTLYSFTVYIEKSTMYSIIHHIFVSHQIARCRYIVIVTVCMAVVETEFVVSRIDHPKVHSKDMHDSLLCIICRLGNFQC